MKRQALILTVALSFTLAGCTLRPGNMVGLPTTTGAIVPSSETMAPVTENVQSPASQYGTLQLSVKWPERPSGYQTAFLPTTTNALIIKVKDGANVVATTTVARIDNAQTATASFSLKAANNLSLEVKAYRETGPVDGVSEWIAQGTGNTNIVPSKKSYANLQLSPRYVPSISALSTNAGITGDYVTITGTNFGTGSVPVTVSFNGYLSDEVTRLSATSVRAKLPPGVPSGRMVITVDGVSSPVTDNWLFWVPKTLSASGNKAYWDPSVGDREIVILGKTRQLFTSVSWEIKPGDNLGYFGGPPSPTWTSTDESAGTVDSSGVFTAGNSYVPAGTQVTASYGSLVSNSLTMIPEAVTVTVDPVPADQFLGTKGQPSVQVNAYNTFSDNATNSFVAFSVDASASVNIVGRVTATDFGSNGVVRVTAVSSADPDQSDSTTVGLSNHVVSTLAGGTSGNVDGTGVDAHFANPHGLAMGPDGCVYVADYDNGAIRKVTPEGVVTTVATGLTTPWSVAVSNSGIIYANSGRSLVKIQGGSVTSLAGTPSGYGFTDGFGAAASFKWITGLAVADNGNIYVCDGENDAIRLVTPAGQVSTLAGSGDRGFQDGTGSGALFNAPYGVAVDSSGNAYVADGQNYRIRKVTPTGVVTTLAYGPSNPTYYFGYPFSIAIDPSGNLYFSTDGIINRLAPDGRVTLLAGGPAGAPVNGIGTNARFNYSFGIAVDASGRVYVADNNRIRVLQ